MRTLRLELPCLPPVEYSANRSRGAAWQRQYEVTHGRGGTQEHILMLVLEQRWQGPPLEKAQVKVTFYLPDHRRRDGLGLLERLKPWIDGLVEAGVVLDDALYNIGFPVPAWEYRRVRPGTLIEVTEVWEE